MPELKGVPKALARLLTSIKHITFNYSDNSSSTIFGYLDSTRVLGMNLRSMEPGWGYVFGARPDTNFVNRLGKRGLLSMDTTFNNQNLISYAQKISRYRDPGADKGSAYRHQFHQDLRKELFRAV